ncbi:oxidoreductase, NAD-binding domain protein [Tritrichomonas foetus]|uniref:Oxidoreductase, NAD-binding domain protein n=1 Tax=Tritrichomonas foetus TaxID=1144522 RepID=A0A1J4JGB7_9EUKA|nr:oxidoreductase, NAD-binding domain protein [Tritrichomonas foetus]|eukprot:OHS96691.1 oxidoreductase, NAD-binding domain protein [Tritrichomonas foetus]
MDKTLRFGVVGTGWITDTFIEAASFDKRAVFTAVFSRKLETAQSFARKHNIKHCFTNLDEMCECDEVDAIYIASPNICHSPQAILCMNHKKHVLVEKPFAANLKQAEEMVECAKRNDIVLMEAMRLTVSPVFKAILSNMEKIGPVHKFVSLFCQFSSKFEKFKAGEKFSSLSADTAGGCLMDIGVYTIYPTVCMFGEPKSVHCVGSLLESGVDQEATIICGYEGKSAVLVSSKVSNNVADSEIQGEKGTILINKMNTFHSAKIIYKDGKEEELFTSQYKNDMVYEVNEFIDIVNSGKKESELNSHRNSLISMKILDEARKQIGINIETK